MAKSKVYAVAVGRKVGIFNSWADCENQVKGYSGAKFKSFGSRKDAELFIDQHRSTRRPVAPSAANSKPTPTTMDSKDKKRPLPPSNDCITTPPIPYRKRLKTASTDADITFLINFDGGSRGNPGLAGCGAEVIEIRRNQNTGVNLRSKTRLHHFLLGKQTNNQAEYWGLIKALDHVHTKLSSLVQNQDQTQLTVKQISIAVQGDSKLIIQQMKGAFRVGPVLFKAHEVAQSWIQKIHDLGRAHNLECTYSWEHVYRTDNQIADECANKAMDAQRSWLIEIDCEGIEIRQELPDIDLASME